MNVLFPEDSAERKTFPIYGGLLAYFPSALAAAAHHSYVSNEKHNPGQDLHHDRSKSGDEADAMLRHLMEADYVGMAWRALSLLQKHCESNGSPLAPAARNAVSASMDAPDTSLPPAVAEMMERQMADEPSIGLNVETAKGNPPAVDTGD